MSRLVKAFQWGAADGKKGGIEFVGIDWRAAAA
jgi:hypothetical protein